MTGLMDGVQTASDKHQVARKLAEGLGAELRDDADQAAVLEALRRKISIVMNPFRGASATRGLQHREATLLKIAPFVTDWTQRVCRTSGTRTLSEDDLDQLVEGVVEVAFNAVGLAPPMASAMQRLVRKVRHATKARGTVIVVSAGGARASGLPSSAAENESDTTSGDGGAPKGDARTTASTEPQPSERGEVTAASVVEDRTASAREETRARWRALVETLPTRCDWFASGTMRRELSEQIESVREILCGKQPPSGDLHLSALRARVMELYERAARFAGEIPGDNLHEVIAMEIDDVVELWGPADPGAPELATTLDRMIAAAGTWHGLHDAAVRVARYDRAHFPAWLWPGSEVADSVWRTLRLLEDPVLREDLQHCLGWVELSISDEDRDALHGLEEPTEMGPPLDRLKSAWEVLLARRDELRQARARIDALPVWLLNSCGDILRARANAGDAVSLIERVEKRCARLVAFESSLHPEFLRKSAELIVVDDDEAELAIAAAESVRADEPDALLEITGVRAMRRAARFPSVIPNEPKAENVRREVQFDHPLSKFFGTRATTFAATLVWRLLDGSTHYGAVRIPLRVKSSPALDRPACLRVRLEGAWRRDIESNPDVLAHLTHEVELGAGDSHDVELLIPMTRAFVAELNARGRKLEVTVEVEPDETFAPKRTTLSWEKVRDSLPGFLDPFVQSAGPEELNRFRLGVERHLDDLRERVSQGSTSFVVYGYRRFGKSSLVRSLRILCEQDEPARVAVMEPVVAAGRQPEDVWRAVADALVKRFDRPVSLAGMEARLPSAEAFDAVRKEAAQRGLSAIYVIIDEAQALFVPPNGSAMGERLKDRLESSWGTRSNGKVPLLIGLVGQMSLRRVMGANLFAALTQYPTEPIGEGELVALLREMASEGGLESSSDARLRLVALAANLYILKHTLHALQRRCRELQKSWFVRRDVEAVFDQLVQEAQDSGSSLWRYVRDPLNESSDLDDWSPGEGYPVALAWARARAEGLTYGDRERFRERVRDILGAWGAITVSDDRLQQAIDELKEDRVIDESGAFCFPLLGRVFEERVKQSPQWYEEERAALERLGLRRVRCPADPGAAMMEGGQASVFRSEGGKAVRRIHLDKTDARKRFMREIELLQKLREACEQTVGEWAEVRRYVPLLDDAGLDEKDRGYGVVIYPWIEGHPLKGLSLDPVAVARIGARLCLVLEKLAEIGIVHADIKPDNILLQVEDQSEDPFVPALIDFGLARRLDPQGTATRSTAGVAEYLPPEVLLDSKPGRWTSRGDVYSLGKSLLHCIPDARGLLLVILQSMTAPEATRWDATRARQEFQKLCREFEQDQRSLAIAREVDALFAPLPPHVARVVRESRENFSAWRRGAFLDVQVRMLHAATFLELSFKAMATAQPHIHRKFLEAQRDEPRLSTYLVGARKVLDGEVAPWGQFCDGATTLVGKMRNAWAHPNDKTAILSDALALVGVHNVSSAEAERRMRDALQSVAHRMDALLPKGALAFEPIVRQWVDVPRARVVG